MDVNLLNDISMSAVKQTFHRILLVDDNPVDRRLVTHELFREFVDIDIREVGDLANFEQTFATETFDLVITDYELQWATGLDILNRIKQQDPLMPVVMFTDSGSQEIAVEAMKAGLDDYVLKSPKHLIRLSQAIRTSWENAQLRRRANELDIRQRFLLNQLQVGVFRASLDGQLIEVNEGFLRLLGLPSLEAAKTFFHQNFEFDTVNRLQSGRNEWEQQLQHPNGQKIWIQVNEALTKQGGKIVIDGLLSDITDKKESAIALQQFNVELEARVRERTAQLEHSSHQLQITNQELELLAYSLSHDLRTPIRQINSFVTLLQEDLKVVTTCPEVQNYLQRISHLTDQANRMIIDLLDYSQTGRTKMQYTAVDMNQIVQAMRQQMINENPDRTIDWHIDPLPNVRGDRTMLRRVWQNLMNNAVKYTRQRDRAIISIRSRETDDSLIFSIQDNGAGFDDQYIERLFTPFQRLHQRDEFEGSGIGLASVKRIIHRHAGEVWASGMIGNGATFSFSLPKDSNAGA